VEKDNRWEWMYIMNLSDDPMDGMGWDIVEMEGNCCTRGDDWWLRN
jgi:hypothetical protein